MKNRRPLTLRQLQALAALKGHPDASLRELGEVLGVTHVGALSLFRALERGGYVTAARALTKTGVDALNSAVDDLRATLNQLSAA
ncbi:MAG TPA: helix-turn-helix domain-containing protein [Archangium sp.]